MTTPVIILALLISPYAVFKLVSVIARQPAIARLGGVLGLSLAFAFFGIGHFALSEPMSQMLPPWAPFKIPLIYASGVWEFTLAAALLVPTARRVAGWACVATLVAFFPLNVYAAIAHIDFGGHAWGPTYLLVRGPLQVILIAWAWWFAARREPRPAG